jgi:hypothetical protein
VTIHLTTTDSQGISIDVKPAGVPEAAGGITISLQFHDGPLAVTLTAAETDQLIRDIERAQIRDVD